MKKLALILIALGVGGYYWQNQKSKLTVDADNPEVITDPVYAEFRIALDISGREISQIFLVQAASQKDCEKGLSEFGASFVAKAGAGWKVQSSECKRGIDARSTRLFNNLPTHVTYVSLARGDKKEREARMIAWGVSVEESNMLCDQLKQSLQTGWKGAVTCVRARA